MNNKSKSLDPHICNLIIKYGSDILNHENMQKTKEYMQHGEISCYTHILAVSYKSVQMVEKLKWKVDMESLIRGALLHDYFLYDWHKNERWHKLHGFKHAKIALANASRDFDLNIIEKEIILKHMFPLNILPPTTKESLVVIVVDKICALSEMLSKHPYTEYNSFKC